MDLFQVDDAGRLFIAPDITDWGPVAACSIDVVIDLDGGLDGCIPPRPNHCLYVCVPFDDDDEHLPDMTKLCAARGVPIGDGHRVLSHCGMGCNRSAFRGGTDPDRAGHARHRGNRAPA